MRRSNIASLCSSHALILLIVTASMFISNFYASASSSSTEQYVADTASTNQVNPNEVLIAVMGPTGSGKSTFINLVSGSSLRVGKSLKSCTRTIQAAKPFELYGRNVTLIDTPGFDDTTKSEIEILKMIASFLSMSYEAGMKLAGVIYFHRISDYRMSGSSTTNFRMFRQLCGESTLKNVVIVTNMWGEVTKEVGEAREAELISQDMFFKPALDKGAQIARHDNTLSSARAIIGRILGNQPLPLQIQRELVDEKKELWQAAAAIELNKQLMEQIEKHKNEVNDIQEELKESIRIKDEESRRELEAATAILQAKINKLEEDAKAPITIQRMRGLFGNIGDMLDALFSFLP